MSISGCLLFWIVSAVTLFLTDMIWTVLLRDFKLVLTVQVLYIQASRIMMKSLRKARCLRGNVSLVDALLHQVAAVSAYRGASHSRCYHSYPDPNEKPIINTATSTVNKTITNKDTTEFQLDRSFKLDQPFPGVPISRGIGSLTQPTTMTTKLENGLIVASQEIPGMMTAFALIVRAGSSYERQSGANSDLGATHFLELNAFRSTKRRSYQQLIEEIELMGGMVQCISNRESIIYVMDVMHHQAEQALDILADTALNPLLPEEELEESRTIVQLQQQELPSEVFSRDLLQRAAYQSSPLSNHHFCPVDSLPQVTDAVIHGFRSKHFFGENCILAVAGMEHSTAVELVRKKFLALPAGTRRSDGSDMVAASRYTGGMLTLERELKEPFVKLAMGFEVGGWNDPLLVPVCVMQQLLGNIQVACDTVDIISNGGV